MRNIWLKKVKNCIESGNNEILIISADLGFGVFEDFEKKFPNNFVNCGVSEQNMIGLAAGMALRGKKVFCYSIGNFPTLRCLEQIRNDVCYHQLDVCIVTVGAGFGYGQLGMSHHATEDLSIMRCMPNINCYIPYDDQNASVITEKILTFKGPSYLRLERISSKKIGKIEENPQFENPKLITERAGNTIIISCGGITEEAIKLRELLSKTGEEASVFAIQSFEDVNHSDMLKVLSKVDTVISIEENILSGGLGSWLSEIICAYGLGVKLRAFGLEGNFTSIVGDQKYLRKHCGIDANTIFEKLR